VAISVLLLIIRQACEVEFLTFPSFINGIVLILIIIRRRTAKFPDLHPIKRTLTAQI